VELLTVLRAMTSRPAEILGLPSGRIASGAPADLVLIDLDYPWQVSERDIRSRSRNTSFEGARLAGKVMRTIVGGQTVYTHTEES
jgi:dihydroorotase